MIPLDMSSSIMEHYDMLRLRELRARKGVSLRRLKETSGVAVSALALYEAGQGDPQLSTLRKLAKALGVTVAELIGEKPVQKGRRLHGTHNTKR